MGRQARQGEKGVLGWSLCDELISQQGWEEVIKQPGQHLGNSILGRKNSKSPLGMLNPSSPFQNRKLKVLTEL